MNKVLSILVGLGMLGYSGYQYNFWYSNSDYTPDAMFVLKLVSAALLGVIGLVIPAWSSMGSVNLSWITGLFNRFRKTDEERPMSPKIIEKHDFDCLIHLRNRVLTAKSDEGLKLISDLNSVIFNINAAEKVT